MKIGIDVKAKLLKSLVDCVAPKDNLCEYMHNVIVTRNEKGVFLVATDGVSLVAIQISIEGGEFISKAIPSEYIQNENDYSTVLIIINDNTVEYVCNGTEIVLEDLKGDKCFNPLRVMPKRNDLSTGIVAPLNFNKLSNIQKVLAFAHDVELDSYDAQNIPHRFYHTGKKAHLLLLTHDYISKFKAFGLIMPMCRDDKNIPTEHSITIEDEIFW